MIKLNDSDLLGGMQTRDTYRHPDDPSLILKIETRKAPGRRNWYDRKPIIPSSLHREIMGYADVLTRLKRHEPFVVRIHGLENTDRGTAVMADNASIGCLVCIEAKKVFRNLEPNPFTRSEMQALRDDYERIALMFGNLGIYNQCMGPENFMLCRVDDGVQIRFFDFKQLIYRQLISPRFIPGGRRAAQMLIVKRVLVKFDACLASMPSD